MPEKVEDFEPKAEVIDKQRRVPYAFHLLPPKALLAAASVMNKGAVYDIPGEAPSYYKVPAPEHINHALGHVFLY